VYITDDGVDDPFTFRLYRQQGSIMATQILTSVVGGSAIASLTSAAGSAASSLLATTTSGPAFSPLTTRFVPPSYCSKEFNNCGFGSGLCNYLLRDVTCGSDGRPTLATDCFPPALRFPDITAWGGDVAYSPAVACPVGWRTMSDSSTPGVSLGTRVVACCPGYVLLHNGSRFFEFEQC
jgi:hypothetical protein